MRYDVMNEYYTEIRLFGKPALFNDMRLDQATVPKGLYLYEVRYDDETWEPVQIAKGILSNTAIPLESRFTHRPNFSFHFSIGSTAVASGRCTWIKSCSSNGNR